MGDNQLQRDPDWDDVPTELGALDGRRVSVTGLDGDKGRWNRRGGLRTYPVSANPRAPRGKKLERSAPC
jgi:hypothetical protein